MKIYLLFGLLVSFNINKSYTQQTPALIDTVHLQIKRLNDTYIDAYLGVLYARGSNLAEDMAILKFPKYTIVNDRKIKAKIHQSHSDIAFRSRQADTKMVSFIFCN